MAERSESWGVVKQYASKHVMMDLDCCFCCFTHRFSFRSLHCLLFRSTDLWRKKYEIIKNYVSRLFALLMFIYCLPFQIKSLAVFASAKYFLVCFKALRENREKRGGGGQPCWSGLFVFHHVHRVYLISVSLFCLFNVAFSGLVCVSDSVVVRHQEAWSLGNICVIGRAFDCNHSIKGHDDR